MKVGDENALHVLVEVQPDLSGPLLPDLLPLGIIEAGVYDGPAIVPRDEVRGDEPEGEGNRHLQLVNPLRDLRCLPDGLRSQLRGVYGHRSAPKKPEISSLASSGLS